jgi:hypothetical protein
MSPYSAIIAHTIVAVIVVTVGHYIGAFLVAQFQG